MKMTKEQFNELVKTTVSDIYTSLAEKREQEIKNAVEKYGKTVVENKLGETINRFDPERDVRTRMGKFFQAVLTPADVRTEEQVSLLRRDLSEGTASAGGNLVPDEFVAEMIKRLPELSELFAFVREMTVSRDTGTLPSLATDVSATWTVTENTDQGETDPAFGTVTWVIKKLTMYTDLSNELLEDAAINVANEVTQLFVEKAAAERDRTIAIGNGSTEPLGLFSASITQSVSVGTLTYDKMVDIEMALPKKYRKNARWILNNTNATRVRKIKDDDGRPIFTRDPSGKFPPSVLGYPVAQQDDAPSTEILFGDLSRYLWFARVGMSIATDSGGVTFKKDQTTVRFKERADGKLSLTGAFSEGNYISG